MALIGGAGTGCYTVGEVCVWLGEEAMAYPWKLKLYIVKTNYSWYELLCIELQFEFSYN